MELDKLKSLLREAVMQGPSTPQAVGCLGIKALLTLLDRPGDVRQEDLCHLAGCRYCQRAVALARRERGILEAPWTEQADDSGPASPGVGPIEQETQPTVRQWPIKPRRWLTGLSALAGIAAMVVVVAGLGWWLTRDRSPQLVAVAPDLLGNITGEFAPRPFTRGGARSSPLRQYRVRIELKTQGYLASLYLGSDRKLMLMPDEDEWAEKPAVAGPYEWSLSFRDDESGPQWIVVIASKAPISRMALRDELRGIIDPLPEGASFEEIIDRLEQAFRGRSEFSFRGHRFELPAPDAP